MHAWCMGGKNSTVVKPGIVHSDAVQGAAMGQRSMEVPHGGTWQIDVEFES